MIQSLLSSDAAEYLVATIDIVSALLCVTAMQVIVVRAGYVHTQRFMLGMLATVLLWNGVSNPSTQWIGEHHLAGFFIDLAVFGFLVIFNVRGFISRRHGNAYKIENIKQPGDYLKDVILNGRHK